MTQPTKLKQPCTCGSTDNPHTCFGFEPAQPTNTDYKSIEEKVEEFKELMRRGAFVGVVSDEVMGGTKWFTRALEERDAIARQQERERILDDFSEFAHTRYLGSDGKEYAYSQEVVYMVEDYLKILTPNDKK